nr:glycosyltransferase [Natronomonas gomsonensis]
MYGLPYILLVRGLSHEDLKFSTILRLLFHINVRAADEVYAAFKEIKQRTDTIRRPEQAETNLFANAVNPANFKTDDLETSRRGLDFDIDPSEFVVGFVGSLEAYHKVDHLILATAEFDDVSVIIVGDGPQRKRLEELVAEEGLTDRIRFTGYIDHDRIDEYIAACDVMYGVIAPDHPGNAIKCYEYLICERPVITDSREAFEFVGEIGAGLTIDSTEVDDVAKAITELKERPRTELLEMGRRGHDYVAANHTWDQLADSIATDIEQLIDK